MNISVYSCNNSIGGDTFIRVHNSPLLPLEPYVVWFTRGIRDAEMVCSIKWSYASLHAHLWVLHEPSGVLNCLWVSWPCLSFRVSCLTSNLARLATTQVSAPLRLCGKKPTTHKNIRDNTIACRCQFLLLLSQRQLPSASVLDHEKAEARRLMHVVTKSAESRALPPYHVHHGTWIDRCRLSLWREHRWAQIYILHLVCLFPILLYLHLSYLIWFL